MSGNGSAPAVGDELSLMSGHFVAAARLHLEGTRRAEEAKEPLLQERLALSAMVCAASALDAVAGEAKALHRLQDPHAVAQGIVALNPPNPVQALLKFVPTASQPNPSDACLREACGAYFLRNKVVHYEAMWAREWPQRLPALGITWTARNPIHSAAPGKVQVRPEFPDDVLCSGGVEWIINACTSFLAWWASAAGKSPWWEGRMVPSRLMVVRFAPWPPSSSNS